MNNLFENYDSFCDEVYKEFKYDIKGGESEYKVIGYMIYTAVKKANEESLKQAEESEKKIQSFVMQFDELGTGVRKALVSSVQLIADALDKKYESIGSLRDELKADLLASTEAELSLVAGKILKGELSKNGVSLNSQLTATIKALQAASEQAIENSESVGQSVRKALKSTLLRLFILPLLGAFAGVILILILQSAGVLSLPVQVNIDASKLVQHMATGVR